MKEKDEIIESRTHIMEYCTRVYRKLILKSINYFSIIIFVLKRSVFMIKHYRYSFKIRLLLFYAFKNVDNVDYCVS